MKQAYIYGLVDPRDSQIHYIGHTVDTTSRYTGHLTDESNTPKTQWISDVINSGAAPTMIVLSTVLYADRFDHEYKWIYLGRAMGWPLTNTMAMKTEAYTHLIDGLGNTLIVEVEKGLTWRKVGAAVPPYLFIASALMGALGGLGVVWGDSTGDFNVLVVASIFLGLSLSLEIVSRMIRVRVSRNTEAVITG